MEYENKYASKGVAGSGLGLGIAGTALGLLNSSGGGLGGLLGGGNCGCSEDHWVNRYEAGQSARIAELETEVKLRDANIYTDQKLGSLRDYMESKFSRVEHELCEQKVFNATAISKVSCIESQIAQLMGLSKLVIPASSVCPAPMPQYNSWTAPTTTGTT
jgi:hypothetical protein